MTKAFSFKDPDYSIIFNERLSKLKNLRSNPQLVQKTKEFYAENPAQFIYDFGMTFDPRNVEVGLPAYIPFVLFEKQEEYINWLYDLWKGREDGLVEKSRDMGVSWLCVAFAVWMFLFHSGTVVGFGSRKEEYVDKIGDPKSLFWKIRIFIKMLPKEFIPKGWDEKKCAPFMRIINPENGSSIIGEAGDNIGRGNRTSIYFKDEAAFFEHADAIDAALSQTSNCKIDVSTPNGSGNAFYRKAHEGKISKFVFDWRDDPRKGKDWYDNQCKILDKIIVAQEIDRNYEGSVSDVLIDGETVNAAAMRGAADVEAIGKLYVGVDVARFGDDSSVITFRRGRLLINQIVLNKMDTVHVASTVRKEIKNFGEKPCQIAVDVIGIGSGVADMLRAWFPDSINNRTGKKVRIVEDVNCAIRLSDGEHYNLRALMWNEMRLWLKTASIPNDYDLKSELTALKYFYRGGEMLLESKDSAKKRGVKSPDRADSIALTFAVPVIPEVKAKMPRIKPPKITVSGMGM